MVDPLREMMGQFTDVLGGYRGRSGERLCGSLCDIIPPELPAALGMRVLRVPVPPAARGCPASGLAGAGDLGGVYECVVVPATCAGKDGVASPGVPLAEFTMPAGWGEAARRDLGERMDAFLRAAGCGGLSSIDGGRLRAAVEEYNALRRLVRGIAEARREKPRLLSCRDLAVVFAAASALPPAVTAGHLGSLLGALDRGEGGGTRPPVPVLVAAGCPGDSSLFDEIEEAGCLVVEDDTCAGRRQYDMSYDAGSPDLLEEILDAFTFRPLCPSARAAGERVELFYGMMKGRGIEAVIFVEDLCCSARRREIDTLRVRLMRSGVDPLVVTAADAASRVRAYLARG